MKNSNTFKFRSVLILLVGLCFSTTSYSREFRIQYVAESDEGFLYDLNKVKDKHIYILPDGMKLYFTSQVYHCRAIAEKDLKTMLGRGFKNAKIRIFFGNKVANNNYPAEEGKCI